jgi:Dienelactone hydrolase family
MARVWPIWLVMLAVVLTALAQRCDAQATTLPDTPAALHEEFINEDIHFTRLVFGDSKFPACDFSEPRAIRAMIGPYTLKTTFYDDSQNPVGSAEKVGRYGAIVDVTGDNGRQYKRFATLFRMAAPFNGGWGGGSFTAILPEKLGIDSAASSANATTINDFARSAFLDGLGHDADGPRLLAWVFEDSHFAVDGSGPFDIWSANAWWWYKLKGKTGNLQPLRYLTFLPKDYDADQTKRWPLLLALHGGAELGDDLDKVKTTPIPRMVKSRKDFPFVVIVPQCPPRQDWNPWELNALLDEVCAKYRIDEDRICATGYSMGGYGVWSLACAFPNRLAAVAPLCGGCRPETMRRIQNLPIQVFHGEDDPVVSIDSDRQCVAALKQLGSPVRFTVYPKTGHAIWTQTYANEELYSWFLQQRRGRHMQN